MASTPTTCALFTGICFTTSTRGRESFEQFTDRLAAHFHDLDDVRPFRKGNGSTQHTFWDQRAEQAGHAIHWQAVPAEVNVQICHGVYMHGNLEPLRLTFRAVVSDTPGASMPGADASTISAMDTPVRRETSSIAATAGPGTSPPGLDAGRGYGR